MTFKVFGTGVWTAIFQSSGPFLESGIAIGAGPFMSRCPSCIRALDDPCVLFLAFLEAVVYCCGRSGYGASVFLFATTAAVRVLLPHSFVLLLTR